MYEFSGNRYDPLRLNNDTFIDDLKLDNKAGKQSYHLKYMYLSLVTNNGSLYIIRLFYIVHNENRNKGRTNDKPCKRFLQ